MTPLRLLSVLAVIFALAPPLPAWAGDLYALVVGINRYQNHEPLTGAVDDARDITDALQALKPKRLILLLDADATRARLIAAWTELAAAARTGDTLFFSYAGHGIREPEDTPGYSAGQRQAIVLVGYGPGKHAKDKVINHELRQWFLALKERGVAVVFVADACYSGGLTRSASRLPMRSTTYYPDDEGPIVVATVSDRALPHVTFLSAGLDSLPVPEVEIAIEGRGRPRGALSFAVAQALRGEADANHDHLLSRAELRLYVVQTVRAYAESLQTPDVQPQDEPDRPVLTLSGGTSAAGVAPAEEPAPRPRLAVVGDASAHAAVERVPLALPVAADQAYDLHWTAASGEVKSAFGDIVAYRLPVERLQDMVDAWIAVELAKRLSRGRALAMQVAPDDRLYHHGSHYRLTVSGIAHPNLTMFSLASDGTVNVWYPDASDPPQVTPGQPVTLDGAMLAPFGAEHVIAIAGPAPHTELRRTLRQWDGQRAAGKVAQLLNELARDPTLQIGLQGLFSAP